MKNKKAIFAVTVRNPSDNFIMLVDRFIKIGENFKKFKIIIIESDSDKKTLNKLHEIKNKNTVISSNIYITGIIFITININPKWRIAFR